MFICRSLARALKESNFSRSLSCGMLSGSSFWGSFPTKTLLVYLLSGTSRPRFSPIKILFWRIWAWRAYGTSFLNSLSASNLSPNCFFLPRMDLSGADSCPDFTGSKPLYLLSPLFSPMKILFWRTFVWGTSILLSACSRDGCSKKKKKKENRVFSLFKSIMSQLGMFLPTEEQRSKSKFLLCTSSPHSPLAC